MSNNAWLEEILTALSNNIVLERLFFTSIELAVLAFVVWLITRVKLVRSPRVIAILWFAVMVRALTGLVMTPPLALALVDRPDTPIARAFSPLPGLPKDQKPRPQSTPATQILKPPPSVPIPDAHVPARKHLAPAIQMPELGVAGWIYVLWMCGVTLLTLYTCVGRIRLWLLVRKSASPSEILATMYSKEAHAMGLRVIPPLCITDKLESPAIAGVLQPVVLFPQWLAESADHEKLIWAARHELMHWKLGDPVVHTLRIVVQILFFYHPVSWWVGKRWEESAELACDRALIRSQTEVIQYAEQLFAMLALIGARRQRALASGLYATRNSVSTRITALLAEPLRVPARVGLRSAIALALFTMLVLGIGGRFAERKAAAQPQVAQAAQQTASTPTYPARTLTFPADRSLGTLSFGGQQVQAQGTIQIPAGQSISLTVSDTGATDLSALAAFGPNDLQSLSLEGTTVRNEDLANIQHLTGLKELSLSSTGVGDDGLYYVQDLTNLERLVLRGTPITDSGMQYLQSMDHMTYLSLNRTEVSDAGIAYLSGMTQLQTLDMWQVNITDEGMQYLQNLTNLSRLGLEDTDITDAGLAYLVNLQNLLGLQLENTAITDEGLAYLAQMTNLRQLSLEDTNITNEGLAQLSALTKLGQVVLPVQISPDTIQALSEIPAFKRLLQEWAGAKKILVSVTDASSHNGIPRAHFSLEPAQGGDPIYFLQTNAQGKIEVFHRSPGSGARIRAFANGYVTAEKQINSSLPDSIEVSLSPAMTIGGTVIDAASQPIADVTVSIPVLGEHNWDSEESVPHRVKTDSNGHWSCSNAPRDLRDFWISLDHPDHATTTYSMSELSSDLLRSEKQILTMADAITLPGYIVDENDKPVAGARIVQIEQSTRDRDKPTGRSASSDSDGYFEIANAKPGKNALRVISREYRPANKNVEVTAEMTPIRITLATSRVLRGRVIDQQGKPVSNAFLYIQPGAQSADTGGGWNGQTDGEGRFEWPDAPKDSARVAVNARGYKDATVTLESGDKEHEIVLESQSTLAKVIDATTGQPIQSFTVLFGVNNDDDRGNFGRLTQQVRDAAGQFTPIPDGLFNEGANEGRPITLKTMFGVRAKGYYLSKTLPVQVSKSASASSPSVTIESDQVPVEFRLEPGPLISGRVLAQDGKPLANARIVVASEEFPINANWAAQSNPVTVRAEVTDGDGNFAASPERAPYVVCVYADDGYAVVTDVELKEKSDITVTPWASLSVSLKGNPPGKAVPVRISQKNSFYKVEHIVSAKDKNELLFDHVMPGEVAVDVASYSRSKYESVPVTVEAAIGSAAIASIEVKPKEN